MMILQGAERAQSLATTMGRIGRAVRSALLDQSDLYEYVKRDCPIEHKEYWAGPYCSAPAVAGLLRYEGWEKIELGWWGGPTENGRQVGELRRLIEAQNVMFWDRYEDQKWRIVDRAWLSAHQDIYNWLSAPWNGGHRCRYCAMTENPMLDELRQVAIEKRDVLARRLNGSLAHGRCSLYLLEWHAIAASYSNEQEARAADKKAGRVSRYQKVMRASALEVSQ